MQCGQQYIMIHRDGVSKVRILHITDDAVKIEWLGGDTQWIWKKDFKANNPLLGAKYQLIEHNK